MDIRELLALEASSASIKKIDQFLSMKSPNDRDYPKALSHLAYLTFQLGDVSSCFQLLFSYLDICPFKEKTTIYNTLIKIYYEQNDYINALKMIEAKKEFLPSYNKNAYYEDLITYYQIVDNEVELRRNLLIYLADDISDERRLKGLITLSNILYKNKEYELFNEKNKLIQTLSLSLQEEKIYLNARYMEADVLVLLGSYPNALSLINELLSSNIDLSLKAKLLALNLKIYVLLGEYRKATIFEAENEYIVNQGPIEAKLMFAEECIKLYTQLNNKFNRTSYEERYNALLEETKKEQKEEVKPKKVRQGKKAKIEISFLRESIKNNKQDQELPKVEIPTENLIEVIKPQQSTMIDSGSKLDKIADIFMDLNNQVFSQFRDYLRQFFINLEKVAVFQEAYLLVKDRSYKGFHYKKERVYDKKNVSITDTILEEAMLTSSEVITSDSTKTSYVDIITNKLYIDVYSQSVICFPLTNGAILFNYQNTDLLTQSLNYEILKLAVAYLSMKYNSEQSELSLAQKYQDYVFVMEHMASGWKRQIDNYIYLSQNACEMFDSSEAISLSQFYTYIYNDDLINYRMVVSDLTSGNIKEAKVRFRCDRTGEIKYYEEDFIIDQTGTILSLINDITTKVKQEEDNIKMAHFDPISGLNNKSKLDYDLGNLIVGNKFSLIALNIIDFKRYNDIYGYDFGEELIFAVGKYLKSYDDKITCYHLDGDKFVVAIDKINDKRTVTKYAYQLCEYLSSKLKQLNYRLNISFEAGIIRYPTDTNEKSHLKIIEYLMSALTSAKSKDLKTNVSCYNKEDYKKQFFESQLITYISEAIDNNLLEINYEQVVDVANNTCDHYDARINLSNYSVEEKLIYDVIKKRDLISTVERYIIHKALFEVAEIYKEIKLYFNISFTISKETIEDETFKDYVIEQLDFFKIPKTAITITYNDDLTDKSLNTLKSLSTNQIFLATSNIDVIKKLPVLYFIYELPNTIKHNENDFILLLKNYCDSKNIRFVISGCNNNQIISHYTPQGFSLFKGNVYKATLTFKDIIKAFLA